MVHGGTCCLSPHQWQKHGEENFFWIHTVMDRIVTWMNGSNFPLLQYWLKGRCYISDSLHAIATAVVTVRASPNILIICMLEWDCQAMQMPKARIQVCLDLRVFVLHLSEVALYVAAENVATHSTTCCIGLMFWDFFLLQWWPRTIQRICIRFRQRQGKSTSATSFLAWVVMTSFMNLHKSCNRIIMIADSDQPQWTSVGHTLLWHEERYFGNKVSWFNVVSLIYSRSNIYYQDLKLILLLHVSMFNMYFFRCHSSGCSKDDPKGEKEGIHCQAMTVNGMEQFAVGRGMYIIVKLYYEYWQSDVDADIASPSFIEMLNRIW